MRQQPSDLAIEHANQLAPLWHLDAEQFFDRQHEGMLLVHRRDVVEPIEVSEGLQVGLVFDELLGAAMEQANVRIDTFHDLAVEFQHEAQYPMGRWVLRSKIDGKLAIGGVEHVRLDQL